MQKCKSKRKMYETMDLIVLIQELQSCKRGTQNWTKESADFETI